jgi:hypothetical protein
MKPPPPPADPDAAKELADEQFARQQRDKKRAEDAKAADKTAQTSQRRRDACVAALAQIKALQEKNSVFPLFRYDEKGEKTYYTDDMRREETERQQQIVRENCPG